ncbi:MAG: PKD domain-containing protein [Bacteroidetes bacterium]|nr:PKD domain-containing protein [Bacteroidota bacterium]MBK8660008.1 PKD domain-containing protein [Bacteroidota bacterium]
MRFYLLLGLMLWAMVGQAAAKKTLALRITNAQTNLLDETTVYLDYGTTALYSWQEDAKKIFNSSPLVPQIYSLTSDNQACFINGFGPFLNTTVITLGVKTDSAGSFRISASLIEKFDPTSVIRLEDRELGLFHDLRQGNYSFSLSTGQNNQSRFFIHVSYPVQIFDTPAGCQNNDGIFQFQQDTTVKWSQCLLYDASNTLVASLNNITGNFSFGNLAEGNYLIAFVYGAYVATISRSLEGNSIELNAMALPVSASINQTISFYTTGRNIDDYLWQFGDGSTITGIANPEYAYEEAGTYTVTVTATNNYGCQQSNTFTITVAEPLSIADNPSQELSYAVLDKRLYLSGVDGYAYTICRLNGQTVLNGRWNEAAPVSLSEYATGIYLVAVSGPAFYAASTFYLR